MDNLGRDLMKITDIKTKTIEIPLKDPKGFATRKIYWRYYTTVHFYTNEGINGYEYCWEIPLVTKAINIL